MGMFDYYEPDVDLNCPECGTKLDGWQGKDGPNELLRWKQGKATSVGAFPVDEDEVIESSAGSKYNDERTLPNMFELHTICDNCDSYIRATGKCTNGIWNSTTLVST
jgi:hypothetical protein